MKRLRSQRGEVNTQGLAVRSYLTAMALALLAVATVAVLVGLRRTQGWVHHSQAVMMQIEGVLVDVTGMESRQRGFLLTREKGYLENYDELYKSTDRRLNELSALVADDRFQLADLASLRVIIDEKRLELNDTVSLGVSGRFDEALKIVRSDFGQLKMNEARTICLQMESEEDRLLSRRLKRLNQTFYVVVGLVALYILIAAAGLWKLQETSHENLLAKDALQTAHDELDMRVRIRTRELVEKTDELTRTNRELDRFAYVASHDLQEPLRKIMMMADLLEKSKTQDVFMKEDRAVEGIQSAANRMRELIDGILSLSRLASPQPLKEPVDMNLTVKDAIANLSSAPGAAQVEFLVSPLPVIQGNPTQMYQLVQNLLGNAVKFRRADKPQVRVATENVNGEPAMTIEDNGIGIEEKYADRIFEVFERLHPKDAYAGSGIGLAICRKIVESYGGKIWVESRMGEGSTFYFTLPKG